MMPREALKRIGESMPRVGAGGDARDGVAFSPLHWMAAGLFLATGTEALASRRLAARADGQRRRPTEWMGAAPAVMAPLAGAVHVARAVRPVAQTRRAARVMDGVAIGLAAVALAAGIWTVAARGRESPWYRRPRGARFPLLDALTPVAFGATGALGLVLDREERAAAAERLHLARRASLVERLVPRRKPKIDRIVVHV